MSHRKILFELLEADVFLSHDDNGYRDSENSAWEVDVRYMTPPDEGIGLVFSDGVEEFSAPVITTDEAERVGRLLINAAWKGKHVHASHRAERELPASKPQLQLPTATARFRK